MSSHNREAGDELLINRRLLLELLRQLHGASSLGELRAAVSALQGELLDPAGPLHAGGDGPAVSFPRAYLFGELDQIAASLTLDRARYYVDRFIRGVTEVRTGPINDLNLNRWKEYDDILTDSLWIVERRDSSGAHTASYWGNFIPQIPYQMMRRYTRRGDWVIDTFAGSGTTLIEAQRLGRHAIGVELRGDIADAAGRRIALEPNPHGVVREIVIADSTTVDYRALLDQHGVPAAQLVIMHPPYFDIIKFSDDPRDLSNAGSVEDFLSHLGTAVEHVAPALEHGRYLVLVIGDKYERGEWIPLGFLAMQEIQRRGFTLKSLVVKNFEETTGKRAQKELWRYRALVGGFYVFKHEYIFVFRKR